MHNVQTEKRIIKEYEKINKGRNSRSNVKIPLKPDLPVITIFNVMVIHGRIQ